MRIMGIDPGPMETGYAVVGPGYQVVEAGKTSNEAIIEILKVNPPSHVAIESVQSYGAPVGRSVFDTCFMIGRLIQVCKDHNIPYTLYPRPEYTRRICGVGKVNDAVLRQALLLRFGGDRKGEPLFALKGNSDKRSAFAVAVYHVDLTRTTNGLR